MDYKCYSVFFWEQSFVSIFFIRIIMSSRVCVCVFVVYGKESMMGMYYMQGTIFGGGVVGGFGGVKIESVVFILGFNPQNVFLSILVVTNSAQLVYFYSAKKKWSGSNIELYESGCCSLVLHKKGGNFLTVVADSIMVQRNLVLCLSRG